MAKPSMGRVEKSRALAAKIAEALKPMGNVEVAEGGTRINLATTPGDRWSGVTVSCHPYEPGIVQVNLGGADKPHRIYRNTPGVERRIAKTVKKHRATMGKIQARRDRERAKGESNQAELDTLFAGFGGQGIEPGYLPMGSYVTATGFLGPVPTEPKICPLCGDSEDFDLEDGRLVCAGCCEDVPSATPAGRFVEVSWEADDDVYAIHGLGRLTLSQFAGILTVLRMEEE